MSALCSLLTHPTLQRHSDLTERVFDVICTFSDDITDDTRSLLAKSEMARGQLDLRIMFLFGSGLAADNWLGLTTMVKNQAAASASQSMPAVPQAAPTPPGRVSPFPSHPSAAVNFARHQQQQHLQQHSMQRPGATPLPQRQQLQQRPEMTKPIPFPLRRWEILPDPTSNAGGNDTAISLSLFGARKVG